VKTILPKIEPVPIIIGREVPHRRCGDRGYWEQGTRNRVEGCRVKGRMVGGKCEVKTGFTRQ